MPIRFEKTQLLWTLLLVAAVWALARTSRTRLAPVRAWTSLSLRIASADGRAARKIYVAVKH